MENEKCEYLGNGISSPLILGGRYIPGNGPVINICAPILDLVNKTTVRKLKSFDSFD